MQSKLPLERALEIAGTQAKLAAAVGLSQPAINKAKRAGRVSPDLAIRLERVFNIPRSDSRPDLWPSPSISGSVDGMPA